MAASPEQSAPADTIPLAGLRRNILTYLYHAFRRVPDGPVELDQICAACEVEIEALNWNIVYLEKCGYIELGRGYPPPPYIACWATITVQGIDLVEDSAALHRRFPDPTEMI